MPETDADAGYWTSLVTRGVHEADVSACLQRHGIALDRLKWLDGAAARTPLRSAGVLLHLFRPDAKNKSAVFVRGAEFALSGLRGGKPYAGTLPHGIVATDSVLKIGRKLEPAPLTPNEAGAYEACFPEHRLVLELDANEELRSCAWFTTRVLLAQ